VDGSGNVFVTGYSFGVPGDYAMSDYATIAYSGTGVPLWTNRYNGPENGGDQAVAVAVDASGNVFVTGTSATIAYSGAGVPLWTNRYHGPVNGNDAPHTKQSLAIAPDGVVVVGWSSGDSSGGTIFDFATVKYISVPLLAIEPSGADVILSWQSAFSDFVLQQNTNGIASVNWSTVAQTPFDNGTTKSVTIPAFMMGDRFYRLKH